MFEKGGIICYFCDLSYYALLCFIMTLRDTFKKRFAGLSVYQIAILLIMMAMLFVFGDSSMVKRIKYEREIRALQTQIKYYRDQTENDKLKLYDLKSSKDNLEKFARENYLMKRKNEEVFIIE